MAITINIVQVVAECTLKESAAINQILGRKVWKPKLYLKIQKLTLLYFQWHALTREEQAKYYESVITKSKMKPS